MTFADVLAPISVDEFLQRYFSEQYLLVRGAPEKYRDLFTWQDLNQALTTIRANDDRVYLVREAARVPRDSYIRTSSTGTIQYLNGPAMSRHVTAGATLVVNQVDELFAPVRHLVESCEDLFQLYCVANLYAGWRAEKGFDVHYDSHDTLIVQVIGRKDWKVWRPTRLHPLRSDVRTITPRPTAPPDWDGTLETGDTLYMPRGWWHVACPRNEPSVHVTLGIDHLTGADLLDWAIKQAHQSIAVRTDIPHLKTPDAQASWLQAVREACLASLDDEVIARYLQSQADRAHTRPIVRLPESTPAVAEAEAPALSASALLRLSGTRRIHLRQVPNGSGLLSFSVRGVEWQCHEALAPALSLLNQNRPYTLNELSSTIDGGVKPMLWPFITALLQADVVWAEPAVNAGPPACP